MKFYSSKGGVIIAIIIFLIILTITSFSDKGYIFCSIFIALLSYLVWMCYDTYYVIDSDQLFYKSALLKGSIKISTIVEIRKKNITQFSGLKPSLSTKGILVKYNKWDDIYISPVDIDRFIAALKNINPNIKTTG